MLNFLNKFANKVEFSEDTMEKITNLIEENQCQDKENYIKIVQVENMKNKKTTKTKKKKKIANNKSKLPLKKPLTIYLPKTK